MTAYDTRAPTALDAPASQGLPPPSHLVPGAAAARVAQCGRIRAVAGAGTGATRVPALPDHALSSAGVYSGARRRSGILEHPASNVLQRRSLTRKAKPIHYGAENGCHLANGEWWLGSITGAVRPYATAMSPACRERRNKERGG
jgi:hypothetical protein